MKSKKTLTIILSATILTISMGILSGCQGASNIASTTTKAPVTAPTTTAPTTTENGGKRQLDPAQMKTNNETVIKELVTGGTITEAQGTKILQVLNDDLAKGIGGKGSSPLASLIEDKTITSEQAETILSKLFGGRGMKGGGQGNTKAPINNTQSSTQSGT